MDEHHKVTKTITQEMERISDIHEMIDLLILHTTPEKSPSIEESKVNTSVKSSKSNRSRSKNLKKGQTPTKQSRIKKKLSDDLSEKEWVFASFKLR